MVTGSQSNKVIRFTRGVFVFLLRWGRGYLAKKRRTNNQIMHFFSLKSGNPNPNLISSLYIDFRNGYPFSVEKDNKVHQGVFGFL